MIVKRIVVGLGNPGIPYENTPHNLGFEVVDLLAAESGADWTERECYALTAQVNIGDFRVILSKPQTYMNLSGRSVALLLEKLGLLANELIVACDDLALPFGKIRIRGQGGCGGHKGLESIIEWLNTTEFTRVRLGIGLERKTSDVTNYLLSPMPGDLRKLADEMTVRAKQAVEMLCSMGLETAMNQFN